MNTHASLPWDPTAWPPETKVKDAAADLGLDRHWRNARTHTLHDPAAWKIQHLGRWAVDGTPPPNHGQA